MEGDAVSRRRQTEGKPKTHCPHVLVLDLSKKLNSVLEQRLVFVAHLVQFDNFRSIATFGRTSQLPTEGKSEEARRTDEEAHVRM